MVIAHRRPKSRDVDRPQNYVALCLRLMVQRTIAGIANNSLRVFPIHSRTGSQRLTIRVLDRIVDSS